MIAPTVRFVFLIGLGYIENQIWKFKYWHTNDITDIEEHQIMKEMYNFIKKYE